MREIQDFVDSTQGVDDLETLRDLFVKALNSIDFNYFAYLLAKVVGVGNHLPFFLTNYPDGWVQHYLDQDYLSIDPVVEEGPRRQLPFRWSDVRDRLVLSERQKALFQEAERWGVAEGMTVPIHGPDGEYATMSLVPKGKTRQEQNQTLDRNAHVAHLMALYFHQLAGPRLLEQQLKRRKALLSPREMEVLDWLAKGKTNWEIAQVLDVTERTVNYHVDNIKKKLDASSRTHVAVKAVMEGLISPRSVSSG